MLLDNCKIGGHGSVVIHCVSRVTRKPFAIKSVARCSLADDLDHMLAELEPKLAQLKGVAAMAART